MSHDLKPNNKELSSFHAVWWSHLLEQCGAYFTCISKGARWYTVWDERMSTHYHDVGGDGEAEQVTDQQYPAIHCNCGGFEVTKKEAKVLARIARNYAAIQRTLEKPSEEELNRPITTPEYLKPFPQYIRRDWVDQFEQFAEWAEKSGGFKIY